MTKDARSGKTLPFTSVGNVTLKRFDEPVTLYEVTGA